MTVGYIWVRTQANRGAYPLQIIIVPLPEAELNNHGRRIDAGHQTGDTEKMEKNDEKQIARFDTKVLPSGI